VKRRVEKALSAVIGLRLERVTRAAGLVSLTLGDFALHVQCPWRFAED
jgi:hypothetical protein